VSRSDSQRLRDIAAACVAIEDHLTRGDTSDGLIFDAIRIRLMEIGEAAKGIEPATLVAEPTVPWADVARMRDLLAHRYFDTAHSMIDSTARQDVPRVKAAAERLLTRQSDATA